MIEASLTIDCDGHVALTIVNNTDQAFTGQYATASSWIGDASLAPGASRTVTAHINGLNPTVSGYVRGTLADGTKVSVSFSGTKADACAPYVPSTTVPDTAPHPVTIGSTVLCLRPGSPDQEVVPCDSPLATTPWTPPTTATTAPVAPEAPAVTQGPPEPSVTVQARTGPPKTHAVVAKPAQLPATGSNVALGGAGGLFLAVGTVLVCLTQRRGRRHA